MTPEDLEDAMEANGGYCSKCKEVTVSSGVEPDAQGYECPDCGQMTVMGIQQAVLEGLIT